jgi:hypothetical protein
LEGTQEGVPNAARTPEEEREETRQEVDRFVHLYGSLLNSAITDLYAKTAKELGIDAETISNSRIVMVTLTDLSPSRTMRPYLHLSSIEICKQGSLYDGKNNTVFPFAIEHEGYRGSCVRYGLPVAKEFHYLVRAISLR